MTTPVQLDSDFLVYATQAAGRERTRLFALSGSSASIRMSAIAWYEYARGPRTAEQLAVARYFLDEDGVIPFSDALAERAATLFRASRFPRRRANDIAIGVTALESGAVLFTRNASDFRGIPGLKVETG